MDLYLKIINNSEESLSNMKELNKEFFSKDTLEIAKNLIGKVIEVNNFKARIIEVEAYKQDEASHAFTKTSRSQLMYETYGHVYVYLIYGIYYCLNSLLNCLLFSNTNPLIPNSLAAFTLDSLSSMNKISEGLMFVFLIAS